jgi:hypothetical protein
MNIQKGELGVKGILAREPMGMFAAFSGVRGIFGVGAGRGLSTIGRNSIGGFEGQPGKTVPPAYHSRTLRLEASVVVILTFRPESNYLPVVNLC